MTITAKLIAGSTVNYELLIPYDSWDSSGNAITAYRKESANRATINAQKSALQAQIDAADAKLAAINNVTS